MLSTSSSANLKSEKPQQSKIYKNPIKVLPNRFLIGLLLLNSLYCLPAPAIWGNPSCAVDVKERVLKDNLHKSISLGANVGQYQAQYQALVLKHKDQLTACRSKDPIKTQALWLRLYAKDAKPEALENVLDRAVNRGYNAVFIGVLYDGRIMLPVSDNSTPWRSLTAEVVKSGELSASYDLWAEVIRRGRARGLKVYGEANTMNFGYSYSQVADRASVLARNGAGETTIAKSQFDPKSSLVANGQAFYLDATEADYLFIDPYNVQAKSDFSGAIAALVKRQPDGILFDYLRYPSRKGLVSNVKDLWIYGESAHKALLAAMPDPDTKELMAIYLEAGKITPEAITLLQQKNNSQQEISSSSKARSKDPAIIATAAEQILWQLAINHAHNGILSFINEAIAAVNPTNLIANPVNSNNIIVAAVFSPNANLQKLGQESSQKSGAYDPRLQPWDRFPQTMERHPMTYTLCDDGKCVAKEVLKVINASTQSKVCPVLAGTWGQSWRGHPSLEIQTQAITAIAPQISCVSHFSYSWIEPDLENQERKAGL